MLVRRVKNPVMLAFLESAEPLFSLTDASFAELGFGIPLPISVIVLAWNLEKLYQGCHLDHYRKDTLSFDARKLGCEEAVDRGGTFCGWLFLH